MANEIPKGESVSNAYRTDPQAVQYIDAETGATLWGYPAYGGSGALIGYVPQQSIGNELNRRVNGVVKKITDIGNVAPTIQDNLQMSSEVLAQTPAAFGSMANNVVTNTMAGRPLGSTITGVSTPVTASAPTPAMNANSSEAGLGTTGTGTSTDIMQPLPRPAYVQPKIETINGKEVVTIEGGSLNRMLQDFYTMGQFYAATEMNMEPPKPQTQYSPETGRKVVDFADPVNSTEAQNYAAQLQQSNPTMSSNQILGALKMPSAPAVSQTQKQGQATIAQLKSMGKLGG